MENDQGDRSTWNISKDLYSDVKVGQRLSLDAEGVSWYNGRDYFTIDESGIGDEQHLLSTHGHVERGHTHGCKH